MFLCRCVGSSSVEVGWVLIRQERRGGCDPRVPQVPCMSNIYFWEMVPPFGEELVRTVPPLPTVLGKPQLQGIIGLDTKPMEISALHLTSSGTSTYGNVMSYLLPCLIPEHQQRTVIQISPNYWLLSINLPLFFWGGGM